MTSVNLSNIAITKARFRYSMSELVDDFLKKKLDKDVREYAKNELGIDYVYKSYDFSKIEDKKVVDDSDFENHGQLYGCNIKETTIKHIKNITLPYRKEGKFKSLYHKPNNMVNNEWVHKKDTGENEQRFITQVQKDKIDIKKDGLSNLDYTVIEREFIHKDHEFITVSLNFSK